MTRLRTWALLLIVGPLSCSLGCSNDGPDSSTGFIGQTVQGCQETQCESLYCSMLLGGTCGGGASNKVVVQDCNGQTQTNEHVRIDGGNITVTETNGSSETVRIGGGHITVTGSGSTHNVVREHSNTVVTHDSSTVIINGKEYRGNGSSTVIVNGNKYKGGDTTTRTTGPSKTQKPSRDVLFN